MRRFSSFIVALALLSSHAHSEQIQRFEAYGDSLTEGLFSYSLLQKTKPKDVAKVLSDFAMFYTTNDKSHIQYHLRPDIAWLQSIAVRLGHKYGLAKPIPTRNNAVSGAVVADLVKQVKRAPEYTPVVAFFLIGHNDLCDASKLTESEYMEKFRREYLEALNAWDRTHQNSTAILLPMLQVHQAFETMHSYVWHQTEKEKLTCSNLWTLFGYCPRFVELAKQQKLAPLVEPIENAMNGSLRNLATEMQIATTGNNSYVTVDPNLFKIPFAPEFFALDCYHPSITGQLMVGDVAYSALF